MTKQRLNATIATGGTAGTAVAPDAGPGLDHVDSVTYHEQIARLAYSHWQARGCPEGSPEEDWFRAESELREQAVAASA